MNPFRIHTRSHRHVPIWVIESADEDSTSTDTGPSARPDDDGTSQPRSIGESDEIDAVPEQPPVLDAPSGAEIRARYSATNHGGMKCLPKNFHKLLSDFETIQVLNDSHKVLPPSFAYLAKGINLVFIDKPPAIKRVTPNNRLSAFLVTYLLKQKVISPVPCDPNVPTFHLFSVPKSNGKFRPIVDFSPLTDSLKSPKFQLPNLHTFIKSNRSFPYATIIDIKDAFLHLRLNSQTALSLRILFQGQEFCCNRLMFRLSPALFYCQLAYKTILQEFFRRENLFAPFLIYLDDILILHKSRREGFLLMCKLVLFLQSLGCPANITKSRLVPDSQVHYLGLDIQVDKSSISILEDKLLKLYQFQHLISDFLAVSKRATARLKGYFLFILQALKLPLSPINTASPSTITHAIHVSLSMIRTFPSFSLARRKLPTFVCDTDATETSVAGHFWATTGPPSRLQLRLPLSP